MIQTHKVLILRAISYMKDGKIKLSIIDNESVVKEFPNNIRYLMGLPFLYGENEQFYTVIKLLKQILIMDSLNVYIFVNLAYYNGEAKGL